MPGRPPGNAPLRVLIVDDHEVVRKGLSAIFAAGGMEVVGQAARGEDGVRLFAQLRPDVGIIDLRMPGMDGVQVVEAILGLDPAARLVLLTAFDARADIRRALAAGALGVLLKDEPAEVVLRAVRRVRDGESYVTPSLAAEVIAEPPLDPLSSREIEVLELIAEGHRNKEIARDLGISVSTAKNHVYNILQKLDAKDRTQAAMLAVSRGLVRRR